MFEKEKRKFHSGTIEIFAKIINIVGFHVLVANLDVIDNMETILAMD
jgi:hypothetical protein